MTWYFVLAVASAGPMPMFGGRVPPPSVPVTIGPVTIQPNGPNGPGVRGPGPGVNPRGPFPIIVAPFVGIATSTGVPSAVWPENSADAKVEAYPARLPFVKAEPVKTKIAQPGVMTPVDELPSGFKPIPPAENRLPVVTVRPVTTIEPVRQP